MKMNRFVYLALKCNFNKPNLTPTDASRMLLYKGPPKTPDPFAWRLVQGKIDNNFDHKGFLRDYQQIIPKIYKLRDRTGIRIVEWSNHNPEDPVRKMDMQLQSQVKKTQAEAQDNDKKSERPQKRKFKIQRRRPLSDLKRQKKESTDVKSSNVEIEVENEDNEIFITPIPREQDDTTQDTMPQEAERGAGFDRLYNEIKNREVKPKF